MTITYHELKTWPDVFEATWRGEKLHEFRRNDRGFNRGDVLILREWSPDLAAGDRYTGREVTALITHIDHGPEWGIPDGFVNMTIKIITRKDAAA